MTQDQDPAEQPPYDAPQPGDDLAGRTVVGIIDGHAGRKLHNALTLTLVENGGAPFAKAQQGKGDGLAKKAGILFGLKNYDAGTHLLEFTDGTSLVVLTRNRAPTTVTRGDGSAVATITRDETTLATDGDGARLVHFTPDPVAHVTDARYRLLTLDADGRDLALLDLLRTKPGAWDPDALDVIDGVVNFSWSSFTNTDTGGELPTIFAGTRLRLLREPTPVEREVLLAASVELGISGRCYTPAMGRGVAWG